MASVKIILGRIKRNGEHPIELSIIHMRLHREIPLNISVPANVWANNKVKASHPFAAKINAKVNSALNAATEVLIDYAGQRVHINELKRIIMARMGYTTKTPPLRTFADDVINELKASGREGNASAINAAVVALLKHADSDICLHHIDYNLLLNWRNTMQRSELKPSSIHNYMRTIRTLWLIAKNKSLINTESPFRRGLLPTVNRSPKKAVPTIIIQLLAKLRPTLTNQTKLAVDARLLQFYLQGIDIADLGMISRSQIKDGYITVTRFKNRNKASNPAFKIKIPDQAYTIINEYKGNMLLPFKSAPTQVKPWHNEVSSLDKLVNKLLKRNGINERFGAKAARHTWLTIANSLCDNYLLIKQAVGHTVGDTTSTYIKVNQQDIDTLNHSVINTASLSITHRDSMAV